MDIIDAVKQGDLASVQRIVEQDPQAVLHGSPGEQPLHYAAWMDQADITRYLLEHGADVNCRDAELRTPLHYAALHNHPGPVSVILEYSPDPAAVDKYGFTPSVYAIRERTPEGETIFDMLMKVGAKYGLHEAVARGDTSGTRHILQSNPSATAEAVNPEQVFVDALIGGGMHDGDSPIEIIELLFRYGLRVPRSVVLSEASQASGELSVILKHYAHNMPNET